MIVLSAGCASLASLMRRDADRRDACRRDGRQTERAPVEADRRPRLIAMDGADQRPLMFAKDGADQRAVWVSPARHTR